VCGSLEERETAKGRGRKLPFGGTREAATISFKTSYMMRDPFPNGYSPDVLFNLLGMKPAIEINFLHTGVGQKFKRIFDQGSISEGEKTLDDGETLPRRYEWQELLRGDVHS
jgi:hypothetical protein